MNQHLQLGYIVLGSTDVAGWSAFAEDTVGLMVDEAGTDGVVRARVDGWQQRFTVEPADSDDLRAVGLVASTDKVLDDLVDRVERSGISVHRADKEEAAARRVKRLVSFVDPAGTTVELASGAFQSHTPFASRLVPGGFVTGMQGLGHAVFMVADQPAALEFWCDVLGFEVSDTSSQDTPSGESNAAFLHCNARHHSIALVQRPERSAYPKRLLHFMIQAQSMDAVGMAYDRALDARLSINRSLGRHPNDRMFSFYATTPGGYDYEFGWGAVEVHDDWTADHYDHISAWGHRKLPVVP